jgi:hypothetical protein
MCEETVESLALAGCGNIADEDGAIEAIDIVGDRR